MAIQGTCCYLQTTQCGNKIEGVYQCQPIKIWSLKCPWRVRATNLVDAIEELISHTTSVNINEIGLEECLWSLETLTAYLDYSTVWELSQKDEL